MRIFQVAFDRDRIGPMLPSLVAEELDRKSNYIPADEFDAFNKAVLKELIKSIAAGRIAISYKMRYILANEINDIINEEEAARLRDLRDRGIPFKSLRKLSESRMINFVNRIGNADLCKIIIDCEEERSILLNCMSRSRKREFMDDLEYFRKQYVSARLTPEEIIAAKLRIEDMLEQEFQKRRTLAV